jgi:hypothetical protein
MKAIIRIGIGLLGVWAGGAWAGPASWRPVGPERGHVVDASTLSGELLVATRVGVMRADNASSAWERDPRFPEGTRRLAGWKRGAWAAPPGQLWEIGPSETRLVRSFEAGIAVDLAVLENGRSFAAVRSATGGSGGELWATDPGKDARVVLQNIDPWVLTTRGAQVWVGTVDQGLWYSKNSGENFERIQKGAISALGQVDGQTWAAFAEGRVLNVDTDEEVVRVAGGHVSSIAGLGPESALVTVISPMGKTGPLQLITDGEIQPLQQLKVDEDIGYLGPTGAWPLGSGKALVGTFRRGPLLWNGQSLGLARKNFRALVSGGAAMDAQGRLVIGGMGTGVYTYQNNKIGNHTAGQGPVTDTVAVRRLGDQISVVDFEGIVRLGADGRWERSEGVQDVQRGQRNGLVDIGQDGQGSLWGIDGDGRLFQQQGENWKRCGIQRALRLDGDGPHLVVATAQGFLKPDCKQATSAFEFNVPAAQSRALGGWVAAPGQLYGGGRLRARLPAGAIQAVALSKKGLLVAVADQGVLLCSPDCVKVSPAPPSPLAALGTLPTGVLWAMEKNGTLLVLNGDSTASKTGAWTRVPPQGKSDWSLMERLKDPWMQHGPGKGPQGHGQGKKQGLKPGLMPNGTHFETQRTDHSRPLGVIFSGSLLALVALFWVWKRKR